MARYVTVSAFSSLPPRLLAGKDPLDHMIGFWREEIGRVLPDRPDLVVLPELCDRCLGPLDEKAYFEYCASRGTRFRDAMAEFARRHRIFLTCPTLRQEADGTWRNSMELLDRKGESAGIYNKSYPTIDEIRRQKIRPGNSAQVIETELGRIACVICFDLNFEELRLEYARQKPDLILFSSMYHGGLMQAYWAYSCRAHFVGAISRLQSGILSPVGHAIASSTNYFPHVTAAVNLDCRVVHLGYNFEKLDALKAKYGQDVSIFDPGFLGPVLVSSQSGDHSAGEMLKSFEVEPIDEYFDHSRQARDEAVRM